MKGFIKFIKSQGVIGLAVAFIMGGSIKELITSFVDDITNPFVALLLGSTSNLENIYLEIGNTKILFGSFLSTLIDFLIIAAIVYFSVKIFGIDKLNKKKDHKKK